ncbi:M24 family metallopeptidase [Chloroflexota bacterium]
MMQDKPCLSLVERDRRYKQVREAMKERGLDALLVWGHSGKWDWHAANIHYLSGGVGGNGFEGLLVFTHEGDPTIVKGHAHCYVEGWIEYGSWVPEQNFRSPEGGYLKTAVERLKELKLTKAAIGIPGMIQQTGIAFNMGMFTALREALPEADLRDASGLIEDIRAMKSPEEIVLMERAAEIGEAAIATLAKVARPGVPENEVVAAMFHTMISEGADLPIMFLWNTGQEMSSSLGKPMYVNRLVFTRKRPLQNGDVILMEFSPRFHGYCGHLNVPAVIGDWPPDKEYEKVYRAAQAAYRAGWNALRPGITAGELHKTFWEPFGAAGLMNSGLLFHGEGLGNEGLGIGGVITKGQDPTVIREGVTIAFEPKACLPGSTRGIMLGDVVQVTRDGPRRVGKREPEIVICK